MSAIFTHMSTHTSTHTSSILHAFVQCTPKSCTLGTRILCRHKSLRNFRTWDLPNGVGTECPSLWYSGQSRRGWTCRCVRTDMTELQHAPMYYTACRTSQWATQYTANEWQGQWLTWDLDHSFIVSGLATDIATNGKCFGTTSVQRSTSLARKPFFASRP